MVLTEPDDARVVGDEWEGKLDRSGDQQPIGGVAMFELVRQIRTRRRVVTQRHGSDSWAIDEALNPGVGGAVEVYPSGVNELRDFPLSSHNAMCVSSRM
jgi:hypothetical protein